jgi:hypothetical protein
MLHLTTLIIHNPASKMPDLLKYLISPPNIPDLAAYPAAAPPALTTPPPHPSYPAKKVGWTDPYYPIHGHSPLRNE